MFERLITDREINSFQIREFAFSSIQVDGGYQLNCESLLRYVGHDGTFITNKDHGHLFGLGNPYDVQSEIEKRIKGKVVRSVELRQDTGDVILHLDDARVEIVCSSNSYENWQFYGPGDLIVIGHGGSPKTLA